MKLTILIFFHKMEIKYLAWGIQLLTLICLF